MSEQSRESQPFLHRRVLEALHNNDIDAGRYLHSLLLFTPSPPPPPPPPLVYDPLIRLFSAPRASQSLFEACLVFCSASSPSIHAWHAVICAHFRLNLFTAALGLYRKLVVLHDASVNPLAATVSLAIRSCACLRELGRGRIVHHHSVEDSLLRSQQDCDGVPWNGSCSSLIHMYARCGSLAEARSLFDLMTSRSLVSWNVMISAYLQREENASAMDLFDQMVGEAILLPDNVTLSSALKACSMLGDVDRGMSIHRHIVATDNGRDSLHVYVANALIDMYAKSGALEEAKHTFFQISDRNSSSAALWNTMISGFTRHGHGYSALDLFVTMLDEAEGHVPNAATLSCVLKACGELEAIRYGRLIHALSAENHDMPDGVLISALLDMYAKCGKMEDACRVLLGSPVLLRNQVTWCVMIDGCINRGCDVLVLRLFAQMLNEEMQLDKAIYSCVLRACASVGAIAEGHVLHSQILICGMESDAVIGDALVNMYSKCGSLDDGIKVFEGLQDRDVVCWNTMLSAHVQHGRFCDALQLFGTMHEEGVEADGYVCSCMLKVCASTRSLEQGKHLHDGMIRSRLESDDALRISLLDMYAKCGQMKEASCIFRELKERDRPAWGALIAGYIQHGDMHSAFERLGEMQDQSSMEPDEPLMLCLLKTCSLSQEVKQAHNQIMQRKFESHIGIANMLIDAYQKAGDLGEARKVFDDVHDKDAVSWNTMLCGYVEHRSDVSAFTLYKRMRTEGPRPDAFTFSCLLKACWQLAAADAGNSIFEHIIREGLEQDVVMKRTLIEMYARCGSLEDARKLFRCFLPLSDDSSSSSSSLWNAIVGAHAQNSDWKMMGYLLEEVQCRGRRLNAGTHAMVLAAYARCGRFDDGKAYFESLKEGYDADADSKLSIEHYNCAIDLFARSGHLRESEELLETMPILPDAIGRTSLLSACREFCSVPR